MNKTLFTAALFGLTVGSFSAVSHASSTVFESADVLTPAQALGRYQWLEKCYSGLLLEVADQIFDPTNPIPNDQKLSNLKNALLYSNGKLKNDAKYITFGNSSNENPKNWFAGTSPTSTCKQVPSDYSVSALMVTISAPAHCDVVSRDKSYEYIKSVAMGNLENESEASYYSNYVGQAIKLYKDTTYPVTLTPGFSSDEAYPESWHVYIDWNQDGDFNDASETHFAGASEAAIDFNVVPPASAKTGLTKMRVSMDYFGGDANACKDINSGEVEDYLLYIK